MGPPERAAAGADRGACRLCGGRKTEALAGPDDRDYLRCARCGLVFVAARFLPGPGEERRRYLQHRNSPTDGGYVAFLERALTPALPHLRPGDRGLDYGCGPVPVLAGLVASHGFACDCYDPLFFPAPPRGPYDFIFAVECFEHFFHPRRELSRLEALLAPGGLLTVMTEPWTTPAAFARWRYARDRTHVCFYRPETMAFIAGARRLAIRESGDQRVTLFRKPPAAGKRMTGGG